MLVAILVRNVEDAIKLSTDLLMNHYDVAVVKDASLFRTILAVAGEAFGVTDSDAAYVEAMKVAPVVRLGEASIVSMLSLLSKAKKNLRLEYSGVVLDRKVGKVFVDGREVKLSPSEMQILEALIKAGERGVTKAELVRLSGTRSKGGRSVDTFVSRISNKLGRTIVVSSRGREKVYRLVAT